MSNFERTKQQAREAGRRAALAGCPCAPNANPGSAWDKWYREGYAEALEAGCSA